MSSPSEHSPERSVSVSSPAAADSTIEDTASSILAEGAPPEVTVQWLSNTPNSAFAQRMQDVRPCSVSPRPRRTASPSKLSVAQQRARAAEEKAESAVSGVGGSGRSNPLRAVRRRSRNSGSAVRTRRGYVQDCGSCAAFRRKRFQRRGSSDGKV